MNVRKPVSRQLFLLFFLPVLLMQPAKADKKAELQAVRDKLDKLEQQHKATREQREETADALKQSERAISDSLSELRKLDGQRRKTQQTLGKMSEESGQVQQDIEHRQERLAEMLKQAYMRGGGDAIKLMLNGENPAQAARDLHYLSYLTREQAKLIDNLRQSLSRLAELKESAAQKDQELKQIRDTELKQREQLVRERNDRQKVLSKLSSDIRKQRRQLDTLKRDEQSLSSLIERIARQSVQKAKTPKPAKPAVSASTDDRKAVAVNTEVPEYRASGTLFSRLRGLLKLPVRGELMNRFGSPREGGGLSWKGLFIRASQGSEVRAVAEGRVAFSDWLRGFGNLLIIDHGEGYMSLYSNNESLYKREGDAVKSGEAIALVGNSGGQEDTGLYFELRHQSRPIDPMAWVK